MKFSIRDLLLVTVIVALAVGWWLHRDHYAHLLQQAREKAIIERRNTSVWEDRATTIREKLESRGWEFQWAPIKDGLTSYPDTVAVPPSEDLNTGSMPNSSDPPRISPRSKK